MTTFSHCSFCYLFYATYRWVVKESEDYYWRVTTFSYCWFYSLFYTSYIRAYKRRKIINYDIFSLLFLLFILCFIQDGNTSLRRLIMMTISYCSFWYLFYAFLQVGSTRDGRLSMTTFSYLSFCYLFYASYRWAVQELEDYKWRHLLTALFVIYFMLHTGGQYRSRKIINDDIFSLLFLLFLLCFIQVGSTRVGRL